jgi:glycerol-3-phosphate dehydrogenase (NAD(P)+)
MAASKKIVGVVGAGSFGTTVASLLAHNCRVVMYSRQEQVVERINVEHEHLGYSLDPGIRATRSLEELCAQAHLIFPIVPSENFRETCVAMSPHLTPAHILIHGTKGLDVAGIRMSELPQVNISRKNVHTMSEVIRQETSVLRVGCLAGPNLYKEIMARQPAASVIASEYDEVIKTGSEVLASRYFFVFGSYDLLGAEMDSPGTTCHPLFCWRKKEGTQLKSFVLCIAQTQFKKRTPPSLILVKIREGWRAAPG